MFLARLLLLPFILLSNSALLCAQGAAKGESGEITDVKTVAEAIPKEALTGLRSSKKDAAALQGTSALQEQVQGKMATLTVKVERVMKEQARDDKADRYRLKAEDTRLNEGGNNFVAHVWVHCAASETEKILALRKGSTVTVNGKVTLANIVAASPHKIHIDLSEAVLK